MMRIRNLLSIVVLAFSLQSLACWYQVAQYNDFIFTINNVTRKMPIINKASHSITYSITNNFIVDFPVTVTMKLTSDKPIQIIDVNGNSENITIDAKLQYRILPNGDWVTVSEYSIESGRLSDTYPPAPYLGRNNIHPKGLLKGQKIMVRLYVTDNRGWQTGMLESKCDNLLPGTSGKYVYDQNNMKYTIDNTMQAINIPEYINLGGYWLPHYVVVLEYSGNERPIR